MVRPRDDGDLADRVDHALEALWTGDAAPLDALISTDDAHGRLDSIAAAIGAAAPDLDGFELRREIGRGGMGVVYEARQLDPERAVAVKVISGGLDAERGRRTLHRREARTLARLGHPNIATLLETGATEDAAPYFVMELVRGRTLRAHVREVREREDFVDECLRCFEQICDGVEHAHARGVIHCDLKPSNIMIDDDGRARILDFGLARLLSSDDAASPHGSGRVVGTVPYLSPEQTYGDGLADVRSDVYSIGAMLYEALTGRFPRGATGADLEAQLDAIRHDVPTPPGALDRRLRGDLEAVVLRAIETDPDARYGGAAALGDDIRRLRTGLPVAARPLAAPARLARLIARHRLVSTLAMLLVVTAMVFAVVGINQAVAVRRERDHAQTEAAKTAAVTAFLTEMLASADPAEAGRDVTVREVLDDAVARLDMQADIAPAVAAEIRRAIASSYVGLGDFAEARPLLVDVVAFEREPPVDRAALARALIELADVDHDLSQYAMAETELDEAIELLRGSPDDEASLADALNDLAIIHHVGADRATAEPLYRESLSIRRAVYGDEHLSIAQSLTNIGHLCKETGRLDEAADLMHEGLEIRTAIDGAGSLEVAHSAYALGQLLGEMQRYDEAETHLQQAIDIRLEHLDPDDPMVALAQHALAVCLRHARKHDAALPLFETVAASWRARLPAGHVWIGIVESNMCACLYEMDRAEDAIDRGLTALPILEAGYGPDHPNVAACLLRLARASGALERVEDVDAYLRRAEAIAETRRETDGAMLAERCAEIREMFGVG